MGTRHTVHTLHFEGTTDLVISNLVSGGHAVNLTTIGPDTGGPYMEQKFISQIDERFNAVVEAMESVLDIFNVNQVTCIESGKTFTGIELYGRALDACGAEGTSAGSTHRRVSNTKARLVIQSINVSATGNVSATLEGILLSADGDAAPTTTAFNVALPTQALVSEAFKLHAVRLAGTTLDADKVQSLTINTGLAITPEFGVKRYASALTVTKTAPTITVETEDTALAYALTGVIATHANTLIEFQKRDATTGGLYAASSTEHIACTAAGLLKVNNPFSGSGSNKATASIEIECTGVAGTPPLTFASAQELTL